MKRLNRILVQDHPRKAYHVTYRSADQRTADGTRQQRYESLIEKLEALPAVLRRRHFDDEAHIATSSWLVETTDQRASSLGRVLSRGLTPGIDLLEILRVAPGNRFELTVDRPKIEPKPTKRGRERFSLHKDDRPRVSKCPLRSHDPGPA